MNAGTSMASVGVCECLDARRGRPPPRTPSQTPSRSTNHSPIIGPPEDHRGVLGHDLTQRGCVVGDGHRFDQRAEFQ